MATHPPDEPIRQAVTVPVPAEAAFAAFADLARWWPREYTWAGDTLEDIGIDPREGGFCFEHGPTASPATGAGSSSGTHPPTWSSPGRSPPTALPSPTPAKASEVEVRFHPAGAPATRVELEHRGFTRHSQADGEYRQAMASAQGWPLLLDRYAATLAL